MNPILLNIACIGGTQPSAVPAPPPPPSAPASIAKAPTSLAEDVRAKRKKGKSRFTLDRKAPTSTGLNI